MIGVLDILCFHFDLGLTGFIFIATIIESEDAVGKKDIWFLIAWFIISIIMCVLVSVPRLFGFLIFAKKQFPMS